MLVWGWRPAWPYQRWVWAPEVFWFRYHGTPLRVAGWQPPGLCLREILHVGGNLTRSGDVFGCQSWLNLVLWLLIISKEVKIIQNEMIEAVIVLLSFWLFVLFQQECQCTVWGKNTLLSIWTFTTWKMAQLCWTLFTRKSCFFFLWDSHLRCDLLSIFLLLWRESLEACPMQNE